MKGTWSGIGDCSRFLERAKQTKGVKKGVRSAVRPVAMRAVLQRVKSAKVEVGNVMMPVSVGSCV